MSNSSNSPAISAIVTKKVIYEVKFTGTPAKETRDTVRRAGLDYQRGQWGNQVTDSCIMSEQEVVTYFGGIAGVAQANAA
jgi:hypothetical protein